MPRFVVELIASQTVELDAENPTHAWRVAPSQADLAKASWRVVTVTRLPDHAPVRAEVQ